MKIPVINQQQTTLQSPPLKPQKRKFPSLANIFSSQVREDDLLERKPKRTRKITMVPQYRNIERYPFNIDKKTVHFYPLPRVREAFSRLEKKVGRCFWEQLGTNTPKAKEANDFLRKELFDGSNPLNLSDVNTMYLPEQWVRENKKIKIHENRLYRRDLAASKGNYIAVVKDGEFFMATKKREGQKHGRIHHSSLVRGKDVDFAGMVKVKSETEFVITNESGHYQAPAESVDVALDCLKSEGLDFEVFEDFTHDQPLGPIRSVRVRTPSPTEEMFQNS